MVKCMFEPGDRVKTHNSGWGTVVAVDLQSNYPVYIVSDDGSLSTWVTFRAVDIPATQVGENKR